MRTAGITKEQIIAHVSQFSTMIDWMKDCEAIAAKTGHNMAKIAYYHGKDFYFSITKHLIRSRGKFQHNRVYLKKAKWRNLTEQEILDSALKYNKVNDWSAADYPSKAAAKAKGPEFYQKCIAHMTHCVPDNYPHYVYAATFTNGAVYIGYTYSTEIREWQHEHRGKVAKYAEKHGPVTWLVLEKGIIGKYAAREQEKKWIAFYKKSGFQLLNENKGGAGCGTRLSCSDEYLVQRSLAYKTKTEWETGCRQEAREAKRRGLIGTKITHLPDHVKHTAETRAKMSAAQKGRVFAPEHLAKIAAKLKGRKFRQETKDKIIASNKATWKKKLDLYYNHGIPPVNIEAIRAASVKRHAHNRELKAQLQSYSVTKEPIATAPTAPALQAA